MRRNKACRLITEARIVVSLECRQFEGGQLSEYHLNISGFQLLVRFLLAQSILMLILEWHELNK